MHYTTFGTTGLRPSRIGFGCSQIASISTKHPRSEVTATLLEAVDRGINFFDTADVYGQGDSERMLGKLFRGKRDRLIYCTKAGLTLGLSQNLVRFVKPLANPVMRHWKRGREKTLKTRQEVENKCFDPAYLEKRIAGSLRRLNTDYLDILLLHSPDPGVLADGRVFEMLRSLQDKGQIRHYGISCDSVTNALQFSRSGDIACIQFPGNVTQHQALDAALPLMEERRIGVVLREPFGGGSV
ncbi:MAG TPA: aldo/keto reductase, partial [Gammaproteobacteria bacterium]|nr:aldo/keto reductase [Gammaproteobacteria bacterium]